MQARGADAHPLSEIFMGGQEVRDGNGALVQIDQATGELIQVATSIQALQARGVKIDDDIDAAFAEAGIPVVESVAVEISDDPDSGGQQFKLRGANSDEPLVLRFDADGQAVSEEQEPLPPEVLEKLEALKKEFEEGRQ